MRLTRSLGAITGGTARMRSRSRADVMSLTDRLTALFAAGMKGAWYERSSVSTLFIENTGITQVSSPGNAIGLGLSKDQGLGRGPESIGNPGGPFLVATGWNSNATLSIVGGRLRCTATGAGSFRANIAPTAAAQRSYEIRVSISGTVSTQAGAWQFSSASGVLAAAPASSATRVDSFVVTPATLPYYVGATANAASAGDYFELDFSSSREIFGNHQLQATSAARPLYQVGPQRAVFDGIDDLLTTTFPSALGTNCTVGRAIPGTGAVISTGQNIGTSFTDNVTACALVLLDGPLTAEQTAWLTAYLNLQAML